MGRLGYKNVVMLLVAAIDVNHRKVRVGVNKIIDIFAKRFESIGWHVSKHHCDGRGNALVATNRKSPDVYDVVLCAHADTVQPLGNAAKYPFRLEGTKAYGAGVGDDKSSLNAVWWICKDLPKAVTDKLSLAVIINPGEEKGSDSSRAFMAEQAKKLKWPSFTNRVEGSSGRRIRKGSKRRQFFDHQIPRRRSGACRQQP